MRRCLLVTVVVLGACASDRHDVADANAADAAAATDTPAAHVDHGGHALDGPDGDTSFAALQQRGRALMGVDQYTSTHLFDALPDGGRIELQRDVDDPEGVAAIRRHLQEIRTAFAAGDFSIPFGVHAQQVPGTGTMARRRDLIEYRFSELPRGGELRLVTRDAEALRAIHEFMAFQRQDHRAGGHPH